MRFFFGFALENDDDDERFGFEDASSDEEEEGRGVTAVEGRDEEAFRRTSTSGKQNSMG